MYLAEDLFCLRTFTIVVLKRECASVVISARGIVIVEVVMQALILFFFVIKYKNKKLVTFLFNYSFIYSVIYITLVMFI